MDANELKVRVYSIPGTMDVVDFRGQERKPTACWTCSKRPCICEKKNKTTEVME